LKIFHVYLYLDGGEGVISIVDEIEKSIVDEIEKNDGNSHLDPRRKEIEEANQLIDDLFEKDYVTEALEVLNHNGPTVICSAQELEDLNGYVKTRVSVSPQ